MYRRQYKPQVKEKQELGIFGMSINRKPDTSKWTVDPQYTDEKGRTHLHIGVHKYCVDDTLFETALKMGCDVNSVDQFKQSPLHDAARKGLVTCVDKLIKKGAHIDVFNDDGMTPLMLASFHGHPTVVKSLVKANSNVNLTNKKRELALHYSCANGHQECVEILLKYRAKVNYPDNNENTPLSLSCEASNTKIVEALLEKGARVDKTDSSGRTPLHLAVAVGNRDIVKMLMKKDASLDAMDKRFRTPFLYAINSNNADILRMLLEAGCDRSTIDGLSGTAMSLTALKGFGPCVQALLDAGEDPDEFSYFGMTALMAAVYESHFDVTEMLLKGCANPNIVSKMGYTALFSAMCHIKPHNVATRQKQAVLLLQYGADVNYRISSANVFTAITNGKNCSMSFAIMSGYVSFMKIFLLAGSDMTQTGTKELIKKQNTISPFDISSALKPILEYRSQPLTLSQLCRLVIRNHLSPCSPNKVQLLPIAQSLKDYVNLLDLFEIEPEIATTMSHMSELMLAFVDVKPCGLSSLKGSFLYETIEEPVLQAQGPGACDCQICMNIRARSQ